MTKKMYKSRSNIKVDGVCAGVADYISADPTVVRLVWAVVSVPFFVFGITAYIICSLVLPREPQNDVFDSYTNN